MPKVAIGLGCALRLDRAMYKAFLEAVAVAKLASLALLRLPPGGLEPENLYDFDANVAYYAEHDSGIILSKFATTEEFMPSGLPEDIDDNAENELRLLVGAFEQSGKELSLVDLTPPDVRDLGFHVVRIWSPDTLSLSLPSAPPLMHRRFDAYGGISRADPHPFA